MLEVHQEPLFEIGAIETVSAMSDAERNANVVINCEKVKARLQDNQPAHKRKAHLVCYGPSLNETWPVIKAAYEAHQDIITVSGAHKFLIERGIIPTIHIDCDPRARKALQFGEPHGEVKYWMGSCVDPSYIEILKGHDVSLWHNHNGYESEFIWDHEPNSWMLIGGGSVGLRAISLLYSQGYRDFEIHGMDCSFRDEEFRHAGDHMAPKPKNIMRVKCKDRWFVSSASFIDYARQFVDDLRLWPNATFRLHGDGLLQYMQRSDV